MAVRRINTSKQPGMHCASQICSTVFNELYSVISQKIEL
jgi:hypothetical protein